MSQTNAIKSLQQQVMNEMTQITLVNQSVIQVQNVVNQGTASGNTNDPFFFGSGGGAGVLVPPWDFAHTGKPQWWTVPPGCTYVTVELWGGSGGDGSYPGSGGLGGYSKAVLPSIPGDVWQINVGGQGNPTGASTSALAYNGGGCTGGGSGTGQGGGATDIRVYPYSLYNRTLVAGGGGGSTNQLNVYGGGGGGAIQISVGTGGLGGTNSPPDSVLATAGTFGKGGNGGFTSARGAGGGGGWYGGGGGCACQSVACQTEGGGGAPNGGNGFMGGAGGGGGYVIHLIL